MDRYRPSWRSWILPQRPNRPLPPESMAEPAAADVERLDELREAGSKMRLPHPIRHQLYFAGEQSARTAMDALENEGYVLQLRALTSDTWQVTGVIRAVPTPGTITRMREQLTELAQTLDGEYAGWGSPVVH